ncbi:hypothetical protein SDC9_80086 [bioreactor metagenome]|uniref:Uncharacterized protein n=1 Tax=bioreactor metagenome TaxID=1076179 RepID=A0A644YY13_9ZZZZ
MTGEQCLFLGGNIAEFARGCKIPGHDGKRFFISLLTRAEQGDRRLVCRIASEVIAANALDRNDLARVNVILKAFDRVAALRYAPREKRQRGAADRAGIRLGMKAAVCRIVIFALAGCALDKLPHARVYTVIGNILHDGEPRTAVGAVDEGVAIAPVGGVKQFPPAVVAQRNIGRDQRAALASLAGTDGEAALARYGDDAPFDGRNPGERRGVLLQRTQKFLAVSGGSFNLQVDAEACVLYKSGKVVRRRLSKQKGTEADTLHNPADGERISNHEIPVLCSMQRIITRCGKKRCCAGFRAEPGSRDRWYAARRSFLPAGSGWLRRKP